MENNKKLIKDKVNKNDNSKEKIEKKKNKGKRIISPYTLERKK